MPTHQVFSVPQQAIGRAVLLAPMPKVALFFLSAEFHPLVWTFSAGLDTPNDPYFAPGHAFHEPVGDYVGAAGGALSPSGHVVVDAPFHNPHDAVSWQHTVADILQATIDAGFVLDVVREVPWANGCKVIPELEAVDGNRFVMPAQRPSLPLMLAVSAHKPP